MKRIIGNSFIKYFEQIAENKSILFARVVAPLPALKII